MEILKNTTMKSSVILLAIAAVSLGSCSTVYKTGQTPDDVYYSPARETEEYVEVRNDDNRRYRSYEYDNMDDRWLRMRVRNPYRWSNFDDYYANDWRYGNTIGYNSFNPFYSWNNYWSWNSYYNPYCNRIIIVNPKTNPAVYSKVRNFSMGSYVNNNPNNKLSLNKSSGVRPVSRYNNSNYNNSNNNTLGTSIRKVFSGGNSSNSNSGSYNSSSNDRPTRTYNPSSSSSSSGSSKSSSSGSSGSSGSSSGSSGGGVSRPGRGG